MSVNSSDRDRRAAYLMNLLDLQQDTIDELIQSLENKYPNLEGFYDRQRQPLAPKEPQRPNKMVLQIIDFNKR